MPAPRQAVGSMTLHLQLAPEPTAPATARETIQVLANMLVIGGFNSNQLLPRIDWELIRANPKVFCSYSDITALQNAILV